MPPASHFLLIIMSPLSTVCREVGPLVLTVVGTIH